MNNQSLRKKIVSFRFQIRMASANLLQWRHNERDGVSNHQRLICLLSRLLRRRSRKISELRVTGLCDGNPPVTGGFPSQKASNVGKSIWWRHHVNTRNGPLTNTHTLWCYQIAWYSFSRNALWWGEFTFKTRFVSLWFKLLPQSQIKKTAS